MRIVVIEEVTLMLHVPVEMNMKKKKIFINLLNIFNWWSFSIRRLWFKHENQKPKSKVTSYVIGCIFQLFPLFLVSGIC